jgi:hypothetical protein
VLVPRRTLQSLPALIALPPGIAAYARAGDFAEAFRPLTHGLPQGCNIGLLARWRAALWEMSAFYAVPRDVRAATIEAFGDRLRQVLAGLPELELFSEPARERRPPGEWDARPSIFTFLAHAVRQGRCEPIGYEDGRRVYRWLNEDVSARLTSAATDEERALAARCCHTPQPVRLPMASGETVAGLRIAAGARLVSGVAMDPALGATPAARLEAELRDMETVLRKAALIARRWDDFAGPGTSAGRNGPGKRAGA